MLLSMWISNTAATAMVIPIVETVLKELENVSRFIISTHNPIAGNPKKDVQMHSNTIGSFRKENKKHLSIIMHMKTDNR